MAEAGVARRGTSAASTTCREAARDAQGRAPGPAGRGGARSAACWRPARRLARIFMSPGPIFDPQGAADDFWRFRHGLAAAGFRAGEIVAHLRLVPPHAARLHARRRRRGASGASSFRAASARPSSRSRSPLRTGPPPTSGRRASSTRCSEGARDGRRRSRSRSAFVIAEMLPESLRAELETASGCACCRATAPPTSAASPTSAPRRAAGISTRSASSRCSTSRPASRPRRASRARWWRPIFDEAYPLLRFGTGDIATLAPAAPCACGRTAPKLAGLLGRVGDARQGEGDVRARRPDGRRSMKRFPEVARVPGGGDARGAPGPLAYEVELAGQAGEPADLAARLADALRDEIKVRGDVRIVAPGGRSRRARRGSKTAASGSDAAPPPHQ